MRGSLRGARLWDDRPPPPPGRIASRGRGCFAVAAFAPRARGPNAARQLLHDGPIGRRRRAPQDAASGGGGEAACSAWGRALLLSRCEKRLQDLRRCAPAGLVGGAVDTAVGIHPSAWEPRGVLGPGMAAIPLYISVAASSRGPRGATGAVCRHLYMHIIFLIELSSTPCFSSNFGVQEFVRNKIGFWYPQFDLPVPEYEQSPLCG